MPVKAILSIPGVPLVLAIYFLVMLGFNFFYVSFPVWAVRGLQWTVTETGIFFSVLSVMMVLVQGPLLSKLAGRISEANLIVGGSLLLGTSFLLVGSTSVPYVYAGAALLALGNGVMWPSILAILSKVAGKEHQGAVQGFAGSAGSVASIIGLLGGGILFATLSSKTFLLSAGIIFSSTLLCVHHHHSSKKRMPGT